VSTDDGYVIAVLVEEDCGAEEADGDFAAAVAAAVAAAAATIVAVVVAVEEPQAMTVELAYVVDEYIVEAGKQPQ